MKPMTIGLGSATAIGSLPHADRDEAVELAFAATPALPAAPSLPVAYPVEGMLAQAAWGLRGVEVDEHGRVSVTSRLDPNDPFTDGLGTLTAPPFETLLDFLAAAASHTGPVKVSLTGPVTLGAALVAGGAEPTRAFATAGAAVRMRGRVLVRTAAALAPGTPLVVFVDEPSLGAATAGDFPLPANAAIDLTSSALAAVEPSAMTGLHCCAPDADWRAVLAAGPQVLSLPVTASVAAHAGAIAAHLDRGAWIAWGAVSTGGPVGASTGRLWRRLSDRWAELVALGCDGIRIREQALLTPECGLARFHPTQAEQLLDHAADLAVRLRRQALARHLQVGA